LQKEIKRHSNFKTDYANVSSLMPFNKN